MRALLAYGVARREGIGIEEDEIEARMKAFLSRDEPTCAQPGARERCAGPGRAPAEVISAARGPSRYAPMSATTTCPA